MVSAVPVINLGKPFFPISRIWNILQTWFLARVFVYLSFFISQILVLLYWTVSIFIFHCVTVEAENTIPTFLLTFYIVFDDFVSELVNKRTSTKRDFSIIAESKPYAHHRTYLHAMKVYNTRPVSFTIEVLFIKIVFFFNHWSNQFELPSFHSA